MRALVTLLCVHVTARFNFYTPTNDKARVTAIFNLANMPAISEATTTSSKPLTSSLSEAELPNEPSTISVFSQHRAPATATKWVCQNTIWTLPSRRGRGVTLSVRRAEMLERIKRRAPRFGHAHLLLRGSDFPRRMLGGVCRKWGRE